MNSMPFAALIPPELWQAPELVLAFPVAFTLLIFGVLAMAWRWRRAAAARDLASADATRMQIAELLRAQMEMQGRLSAMTDVLGRRQSELNQVVGQRLDGMTERLGTSLADQNRATHENLRRLQERLAVIDAAQNNIQLLAKDVVGLQAILANKQTRGAFGQGRMEAIVADALPAGAFQFQSTLSNGARPDCTIRMPNGAPRLVIDAKFPLEAWNAWRNAASAEERKRAFTQFRQDMDVHIRAISEKYLIAGETQETAFLFVPSESIFAELHEHFEAIVQRGYRANVVIVSPSLLTLSIQVVQSMLKDQRMREQAHLIQDEVVHLLDDLARLDERTRKLQSHFQAAQKDVEMILVSAEKIGRRSARIEGLDFETQPVSPAAGRDERPLTGKTGLLKLRVVDED